MSVTFSYLVTRFFVSHLANERKLAQNTIASYSDCRRLLIDYACRRFQVAPEQLGMDSFSSELVLDFLDALESERNNLQCTRNQRLAAIKAFLQFLARTVPELMHLNECIQAIRPKSTDHKPPPSLTRTEVDAILAQPDPTTLTGTRDKALMQILYNTGARVQEEVSIERKRAALAKAPTPASSAETPAPTWRTPALMQFLNKLSRSKHYVA